MSVHVHACVLGRSGRTTSFHVGFFELPFKNLALVDYVLTPKFFGILLFAIFIASFNFLTVTFTFL